MTTFTIHTENKEQLNALKAIAKALKMKFTVSESDDLKLTGEQKQAIDQGLQQIEQGKVISHEQAMTELKKRHPKYFK